MRCGHSRAITADVNGHIVSREHHHLHYHSVDHAVRRLADGVQRVSDTTGGYNARSLGA